MERRVYLTRGGVMLTPRGGYEPESVVNDEVSPGDSISQVGLTTESLRLHNKRLRGHGWTAEEPPVSPPRARQRTEMKPPATGREGRPQATGSTAAVVTGPKLPLLFHSRGGSSRLHCRHRQRGHHLSLQRPQRRHCHRQRRYLRRQGHSGATVATPGTTKALQLSPRHHPRRPRRRRLPPQCRRR